MHKNNLHKKGRSNKEKLAGKIRKGKKTKNIPLSKMQRLASYKEIIVEAFISLSEKLEEVYGVEIKYNVDQIKWR